MTSAWLAASIAVAGALPVSPAAASPHSPTPTLSTAATAADVAVAPTAAAAQCGFLQRTGETRCFPTFADELRWVGFADVPDGYGIDQYFAGGATAAGPTLAASVVAKGRSLPPGYAFGAIYDGGLDGESWVHWGPSNACPVTHSSLQYVAGFNNVTDGVANGLCGTMKLFDGWSGTSCNTSTHLTTASGGWNHYSALAPAHIDRTSCIVFGA